MSVAGSAPSSFTVTAALVGAGELTYQWQMRDSTPFGSYTNASGTGITGATTATLSIANSFGLNGYRFRCIVGTTTANSAPTKTSSIATLLVF